MHLAYEDPRNGKEVDIQVVRILAVVFTEFVSNRLLRSQHQSMAQSSSGTDIRLPISRSLLVGNSKEHAR